MAYKVSFLERASREYLASLMWYKDRSAKAAEDFVRSVNEALQRIADDPKCYCEHYIFRPHPVANTDGDIPAAAINRSDGQIAGHAGQSPRHFKRDINENEQRVHVLLCCYCIAAAHPYHHHLPFTEGI